MAAVRTSDLEDPYLGSGPDEEASEIALLEEESDSGSVLSDDSVLPDYERGFKKGTANTLYEACVQNDAQALKRVLERGVTHNEVMEVDINGWVRLQIHAGEHKTHLSSTD